MAVKKKASRKKAPKKTVAKAKAKTKVKAKTKAKAKKKVQKKKTSGKKAPQKKTQRKKPPQKKVQRKKTAAKKATKRPAARGVHIDLAPELKLRLEALALSMGKNLDQLLIQAASEFADTWEDHQRVIEALDEGDDRVQIVVGRE